MYNLTTPFSGCLQNISVIHWFTETYTFLPDAEAALRYYWHPDAIPMSNLTVSLGRIIRPMRDTEHLQKH
ncbi:hypothetical protein GDO78_005793 [Eleutherodactylus coqui]|uniref:Uncharacterized protein n=1 Tax=Eleutherodactylus coqui TaxID=57060 RepID=A0A8J6FL39_ELECQ|nr:hypothetical protein GDO78_005793 [Eleutherodactylus coqui]